jgi:hypothetical protein
MNFNVVEGEYVDFDKIKDKFAYDYLYTDIPNPKLKKKYGLTKGEWKEFTDLIKKENGLNKRPRKPKGKYYYRGNNGFRVAKWIRGKNYHFGTVPTEEIAQLLVEKCKEVNWDIEKCYKIVYNWRKYV